MDTVIQEEMNSKSNESESLIHGLRRVIFFFLLDKKKNNNKKIVLQLVFFFFFYSFPFLFKIPFKMKN